MQPRAVIYCSKHGATKELAQCLGKKLQSSRYFHRSYFRLFLSEYSCIFLWMDSQWKDNGID